MASNGDPILRVEGLAFRDGTQLDVSQSDVVVFVGPNNVGKTRLLSDVHELLLRPDPSSRGSEPVLLESIERSVGGPSEIWEWLVEHYGAEDVGGRLTVKVRGDLTGVQVGELRSDWPGRMPSSVGRALIGSVQTQNRLAQFGRTERPDPRRPETFLANEVAIWSTSESTQAEINSILKSTFGLHVFPDSIGQEVLPRVTDGELPDVRPKMTAGGLATQELAQDMEAYRPLDEQGDGVKALVRILFGLLVEPHAVQLIDEPEAFLHPPQAKLAGSQIVLRASGRQTFVATHSADVLRGMVNSSPDAIMILRLTRQGDSNTVHALSPDKVLEVASQTSLQYSRALEAVFHDGAVVCEGADDCTFYEAAYDHLVASSDSSGSMPDLLFVPAGGKSGQPPLVKALRELGVPVATVSDIDVFNSLDQVRSLAVALGGELGDDHKRMQSELHSAISGTGTLPKPSTIEANFNKLIGGLPDKPISSDVQASIQQLAGKQGGWKDVKRAGRRSLTSKQLVNLDDLSNYLRSVGGFVVDGELESFALEFPKDSSWIHKALDSGAHQTREAQEFVARLARYFGGETA